MGVGDALKGLFGRKPVEPATDAEAEDEASTTFGDAQPAGPMRIGEPIVFESRSPSRPLGAVFEDDGTTGWFYGLDFGAPEWIQTGAHVYDVWEPDEGSARRAEIRWSSDGWKVGLYLDEALRAALDFQAKRAYTQSNATSPTGAWSSMGWPAEADELIR